MVHASIERQALFGNLGEKAIPQAGKAARQILKSAHPSIALE
jgi:hypothetical protein